ncbi:hypothetical protein PR048_022392 [Dryococelus australis]|uniref:GH16 domain-containing protein n=1 Tax=Dryococelus australis TaxID=614101 RepID=A0ABQ9H0W9_9NEOP|nr:hypothetical protein PR048_022392 [Dryococelus australis]
MKKCCLAVVLACGWCVAAATEDDGAVLEKACEAATTTASGSRAPSAICKGDLIFDEQFSSFDLATWEHEITLAGGGSNTPSVNRGRGGRAVSPPAFHHGEPSSIPGRVTGSRMWESCRTMPLVGGPSRGSPVSPAPSLRCCSILIPNHSHRLSRPRWDHLSSPFHRHNIFQRARWGSIGAVARALDSHLGDPGPIPGWFAPGFSHVLYDAACRRVFSGYSRFPRPCIPAPLHPRISLHVMSGDDGHLRVPAGKPVTRRVLPRPGVTWCVCVWLLQNWEFELYYNNRSNSYVKDGKLYITPTLTADHYGEAFLSSGTISLYGGAPADACTNPSDYGCSRTGTATNVLNPVESARIRSINSFRFKYGKLEIKAKMSAGDWLWPGALCVAVAGLWLLPLRNEYSTWPASGEIDLAESRGNAGLTQGGLDIGTEHVGSTLQFGPYSGLNSYQTGALRQVLVFRSWLRQGLPPLPDGVDPRYRLLAYESPACTLFNTDGLTKCLVPDHIKFSLDGAEMGTVAPPSGGFWELGQFSAANPSADNPWRGGTKMAPFDQEFYILLNVACGGVNGYFPDDATNPRGKPWLNTSPKVIHSALLRIQPAARL